MPSDRPLRLPSEPFGFLALGDSYTIGEGVPPETRWPVLLADALRARGVSIAAPTIVAETGWTTDELSEGIDRAAPQGAFGLVSLLIGVNDQYRKRSVATYRAAFRALLERAIGCAEGGAGRVLVLTIPDWGGTPFAAEDDRSPQQISAEIDAYNAAAIEEATAKGVHVVDVTPLSRAFAGDPDYLTADGLHPSGAVYAAWTDLILQRIALP